MNTTNWKSVTFRSSAVGNLLTEPQSKAAKESGELSETTKSYLISRYIEIKYGRKTEIKSKYLERGKGSEDDSVTMLSMFEGEVFDKNEEPFSNEWITGTPDLFRKNENKTITEVLDIKTCWSLETLLANVNKPLNPIYEAQMQSYLALTGAEVAWVCYCLPDFDLGFIETEKMKLFTQNQNKYTSELSPQYLKDCEILERNYTFQDIPLEEKIIKFRVDRNEDYIQKIYRKVEKSRIYLQELEEKHFNFNK
jgi:hypothetical protein